VGDAVASAAPSAAPPARERVTVDRICAVNVVRLLDIVSARREVPPAARPEIPSPL
jgi:hypothetical protein